jgi:hypothetical protein
MSAPIELTMPALRVNIGNPGWMDLTRALADLRRPS